MGILISIFIVFTILLSIIMIVCSRDTPYFKLKRYKDISLGMSKEEVLSILGNKYTRSLLANGEKYEWRICGQATHIPFNGTSYYTGVRKIAICFINNKVSEVKVYNV